MYPHPDRMLTQRLDGMLELDTTTVDLVALGRQRRGNVLGGDRSEQLAFFTSLARERHRDRAQLRGRALRLSALRLVPDATGAGFRGDALLVPLGGLEGQALREQIVAGIAGLDTHHLSRLAERRYVLAQDHFHHRSNPPV